jgi:hypothetical protein
VKGVGLILVIFCSAVCLGYASWNVHYDGTVDFVDFADFAAWWSTDNPYLTDLIDLNCDGNADFNDFALLMDQWLYEDPNYTGFCDPNSPTSPDCPDRFKFCRTSPAYNPDGNTSANNEVQWRTFALVNQSVVTAETICDHNDLVQSCENANYIFAVHPYGDVYRKPKNGSPWERIADFCTVNQLWAFKNGTLIGAYGRGVYRRSTDNGETWTSVTTVPDVSENGYFTDNWSFGCSDNGTAILVEYGDHGELPYGRRIFRSTDDGNNWTTVFDAGPDFNNVDIKHMHTVRWHRGTGKFVVSCGDVTRKRFLVSDDDGLTWTSWKWREGLQPAQLLDYGHPTKILCGSDEYAGVYTLDVVTGEAEQVVNNWKSTASGQARCFVLRYFNGIFYAFEYDERSNVSDRVAKISVSKDLEHWAVYHQFANNEHGVRYCSGVSDGNIHATVVTDYGTKTITINEAEITEKPLVAVNPASNNLLNSRNKSISDTNMSAWYPYKAVCELADEGGLFATKVPRFKLNEPAYDYMFFMHALYQASIPADGRQYVCRFWARGYSDDACFEYWLSGSNISSPNRISQLLKKDRWYEFCTAPLVFDGVGGYDPHGRLFIYVGSPNIPLGHEPEVYIGGVTINEDRSTFQMGGTPRAKTTIVKPVQVGNEWTSLLTIVTDARSEMLGQYKNWLSTVTYTNGVCVIYGGKTYKSKAPFDINHPPNISPDWWEVVDNWRWHIKTWGSDYNNKLVLYLDSLDMKFKLDVISQGAILETLVETKAFPFEWQSQMDFAVRVGNGHVTLTIAHGGTYENLSSQQVLPADYMTNGLIVHRLGSQDDSAMITMPFFLYDADGKEFDYVLTDSEVWNEINSGF